MTALASTFPAAVPAPASSRAVVAPAPVTGRAAGSVTVTVVVAAVALVAVVAAGAARGHVDAAVALVAGLSVAAAHVVAGLAGRRTARRTERRRVAALDETEAACETQLESRRRSLRRLWPSSADLVERLRSGEPAPVVGAPSIVVLGGGTVVSGVVLAGDADHDVADRQRTEALRARVGTLPDGPLCVDATGGVHVRGPALLVDSLAGGYRAQLRHRGAPPGLVTWQHTGADLPAGGADGDVEAACLVDISGRGAVVVLRRDGVPCSVPVTPSWTSALDAPVGAPVDTPRGAVAPVAALLRPACP